MYKLLIFLAVILIADLATASNVIISPNMGMPVPVVGQDPGPDWANNINASLGIIDSHNHSPGQGVQINPDGLNINADLPFNNNNITGPRSVRFNPQGSPISGASDLGAIYESGVDLYYNDGSGNQVRITQGGNVTGASGTITGLPSGTASASYSSIAGSFTFQSATNTPATMNVGPLVIGAAIASPKTVTLGAAAAQPANYSITFPLASPTVNQFPMSDGSGNLSWVSSTGTANVVRSASPTLSGTVSGNLTFTGNPTTFANASNPAVVMTAPDSGGSITSGNEIERLQAVSTSDNLDFGVSSTNRYGWIRAFRAGTGENSLLIQPSGGSVGIGTTAPAVLLDAQLGTGSGRQTTQNLAAGGNSAGNGASLVLGSTQTQAGYVSGLQTSANTGDLVFGTQSTGSYAERARFVGATGKFGVGTTTPATTLDVNGPITASGNGGNVPHNCTVITNSGATTTSASCGSQIATGGGCETSSSIVSMYQSRPSVVSGQAKGWACGATSSATVTAYAICCDN